MESNLSSDFEELKKQFALIKDKMQFIFGDSVKRYIEFYDKLFSTLDSEMNKLKDLEQKLEKVKANIPLLKEEKEKIMRDISDVDSTLNTIMKSLGGELNE
ncbi:MAG: hypothetical protein QXD62_03585 [Candidatus Woesearchaeota archaeon]